MLLIKSSIFGTILNSQNIKETNLWESLLTPCVCAAVNAPVLKFILRGHRKCSL